MTIYVQHPDGSVRAEENDYELDGNTGEFETSKGAYDDYKALTEGVDTLTGGGGNDTLTGDLSGSLTNAGFRKNDDGSWTRIDDAGAEVTLNPDGSILTTKDKFGKITSGEGAGITWKPDGTYVNDKGQTVDITGKVLDTKAADTSWFTNKYQPGGKWDVAALAKDGLSLAGAIAMLQKMGGGGAGAKNNTQPSGYQGSVPDLVYSSALIPQNDPNRRPGSAQGLTHTGGVYSKPADAAGINAILTQQAADIKANGPATEVRTTGSGYGPRGGVDGAVAQDLYDPNNPAHVKALQDGAQHMYDLYNAGGAGEGQARDFYNQAQYKYGFSDKEFSPFLHHGSDAANPTFTADEIGAWKKLPAAMPAADPNAVVTKAIGGPIDAGYAKGGIAAGAAPYYLGGATDGMADEVPATIDGKQPARLAHGEFVVPADVVSHLGNGNSDAGAKKLYDMMSKLRKARTGNPKQGKRINPDHFLPGMKPAKHAAGGIMGLAEGGAVRRFDAGGVTSTPGATGLNAAGGADQQSPLASWAGDYVTNMLGEGKAVATDMTANPQNYIYQGARTAGPSALQTQAFNAAGNLSTDPNIANAATAAGGIATSMQGLSYAPTSFSNQYQAVNPYAATSFANQYKGTDPYAATTFQNQYKATDPYQTTQFTGDKFTGDQVSQYMNPYLKGVLTPQLDEARRQADMTRIQNANRLVSAGAYGGDRQAIMEAEGNRNLATLQDTITGKGYSDAYTAATNQFNTSQNQSLAQQQATEASKQFGATQGVTNAANLANYGQQAANASELSKQFGKTSAMTEAGNVANYGQQAANASELSKQYGYGQDVTQATNKANYGQQAANASELSNQYGAKFGLDALNNALTATKTQGDLGIAAGTDARANVNTQSTQGGIQQGIEQAGLTSDMNKFNEQAALPGQAVKLQADLLKGLPITNTAAPVAQDSLLQQLSAMGLTLADILGTKK